MTWPSSLIRETINKLAATLDERLNALIAALAAVGATTVGYFSYRTSQRSAEAAELAQLEDRLNHAIDKLDDPDNVAVRVAGIDQLGSLLQDSPKHHDTIVNQLSAFVCDRAPLSECNKDHHSTPDDVQQALTTTDTNLSTPGKATMKFSADLSQTCLRNAKLSNLRFPRANFSGTELSGTEMSGIEPSGAILFGANLDYTQFMGGNLTCTIMTTSSVRNA